jgi:hypothetical protein
MSDPLMVVEGAAFGHSDLISITRYYPINDAITYKAHTESRVTLTQPHVIA